ncbi:MAG TPA: ABC transporter permease [Ideonella sp.]|uniref:ABC transporter permease n=1 Tax=Ideonella sp. TaxID=1929293 RepID=UPI002BB6C73D|nr:ABC transporter permease [Ideonella sp.]HSI51176.1 ABC transporter permease [Ideonella sp.]
MGFKLVILWTDIALWLMALSVLVYVVRLRGLPQSRSKWLRVLHDPAALSAGFVLLLFVVVTLLDSVHFRRALPPNPATASTGQAVYYDATTSSLLDEALRHLRATREATYSAPLATHAHTRDAVTINGEIVRTYPRLQFGGAHLADPARDWAGDITRRILIGLALGLAVFVGLALLIAASLRRAHGALGPAWQALWRGHTELPLRPLLATLLGLSLVIGPVVALAGGYHVMGTDRTGNDVLLLALKSVRTAFVIGALSTLATLPLAIVLGVLAGYFKGWVDELIQYLYTTLSSVPSVLLIAACVLMVQVFLDKNPDLFETGLERADLKTFLLCVILGLTGWATLCRLVRAETLKLRELDFVQAATAFGVSHWRIMARHIVPNVMHLVLITTVLSFSDLILYEAVLTYVGVGVDPSTSSFGGMINLARNEMSRDPVVWWSFSAAFFFMVMLVLAANLFADGVRDAFDPRARAFRVRLLPKKPAVA